jgi:long-chain fatty acid transport protein
VHFAASRALASILAAYCTIAVAPTAVATPADIFGWGPRTQAAAGSGATLASGHEAVFTNPAQLGRVPEPELTLGYHSAVFALEVEGGSVAGRYPARGVSGSLVGMVAPLRLGEQHIGIGFAARSPSNLIVRTDVPFPEEPQFPLLVPRSSALDLSLGIGTELAEVLSFGAALRTLASLAGGVDVADDGSGRSRAEVRSELRPVFAATAGASLKLSEVWRLAFVFRDALVADFDVKVRAEDLGALALPELDIAGVSQYDPLSLHLEVSRAISNLTLIAAATYKRWSKFPGFLEATTSCPATRPNCAALVAEQVELYDTWVPRLAATYQFSLTQRAAAEIRAGYAFEPTPVAVQDLDANRWDNSRHVLGVGYGVELSAPIPLSLDVAYQLHLLSPRTHDKDASVAIQNAGYPSVTTSGNVQSVSLTAGVEF